MGNDGYLHAWHAKKPKLRTGYPATELWGLLIFGRRNYALGNQPASGESSSLVGKPIYKWWIFHFQGSLPEGVIVVLHRISAPPVITQEFRMSLTLGTGLGTSNQLSPGPLGPAMARQVYGFLLVANFSRDRTLLYNFLNESAVINAPCSVLEQWFGHDVMIGLVHC